MLRLDLTIAQISPNSILNLAKLAEMLLMLTQLHCIRLIRSTSSLIKLGVFAFWKQIRMLVIIRVFP